MVELGKLFQRLVKKEVTLVPKKPEKPPRKRITNPAAEPDLARLEAFRIPGVLNGTLPLQRIDGVEVIDFDHFDSSGNFVRKFYPGADISNFQPK